MGSQCDHWDVAGCGIGFETASCFPSIQNGQTHIHQDQIGWRQTCHVDADLAIYGEVNLVGPLRINRRESMSRFISLSSTNRILGMVFNKRGVW